MADLSITAANVLASNNATIQRATAGVTLTAGQIIYLDPQDQRVKLADANGTAPANTFKGVTLNGAAAGQPVNYVALDNDFTPGATLVPGTVYVLSATPGAICPSTDLTAGMTSIVLGAARSATKLNLNPTVGGVVPA